MKKKVLLITKVWFLDAALEYIKEVAELVELHVLIEVDPITQNSNIIEIDQLPNNGTIFNPEILLKKDSLTIFKHFSKGCKSFNFFIHQCRKSFNPHSFYKSIVLYSYIRKLKPDFIHFDDVSLRLVSLLPFISNRKYKLIINVHDPLPHSGEKSWKNIVARKLFYKRANKFITFSTYSKNLFNNIYNFDPLRCSSIKLKPYSFYSMLVNSESVNKKYISFIGRLSKYKGIDIFIEAINQIQKVYPKQEFLIAGNTFKGFDTELLSGTNLPLNTTVIQRHLSVNEMSSLIRSSILVVCPYRDATQSGVVMTAYSLNTPVVVTDVGGLAEYVLKGSTGYISACDSKLIAAIIIDFLSNKQKLHNDTSRIDVIAEKYFSNSNETILNIYN